MNDFRDTQPMAQPKLLHLCHGGTSVLIDLDCPAGPSFIHWGRRLPEHKEILSAVAIASRPQRATGGLDQPSLPAMIATTATGWFGTPAIEGHRAGRGFSLKFDLVDFKETGEAADLLFGDVEAGLEARLEVKLGQFGLLWQRIRFRNTAPSDFTLQSAQLTFPIPNSAGELLDSAGQWLSERTQQRQPFAVGAHLRESRRGRPGLDSPLLIAAGEPGFGFESGLVHAIHVAWSGGYRLIAERTADGTSLLHGGEFIAAGEIILASGDSYESPWVVGSWGDGLNQLSHRFHEEIRARAEHPKRARPVTINTWEAVRFDLVPEKLLQLAELAAEVGVERFVLDDGWFSGRRNDTSSLGDWYVDPEVWPTGLHPLTNRIADLGLEFGLWIEPEMVSTDSELARAHPDWILRARDTLPPSARHQQVLDLTIPAAFDYVLERLSSLLGEYPISYLKWDHNRDLVDAGSGAGGSANYRQQVLALYELMDRIRELHPNLEIESCASGGGRIDLGIVSRVERFWPSDNLDPLDRLGIQRFTRLLVPPEMIGAHVSGAGMSSRQLSGLDLSAISALLCHFGVEWDLTQCSASEIERLKIWIEIAKRYRDLVARGKHVEVDGMGSGFDVRGVVAQDGKSAVFTAVRLDTDASGGGAARLRFPGLEAATRYLVRVIPETSANGIGRTPLEWAMENFQLTGRELSNQGVRAPLLAKRTGVVIEFSALG
jgi:alpha-galactosidase